MKFSVCVLVYMYFPSPNSTPCMHTVYRSVQKNVCVKEVDLLKANVNSDDVFILDLGLKIYQV